MDRAITITNISKVYHIYDNPRDRLKEVLSFSKKRYFREFRALDGVTFDIGRGETVGIIGRNGSGKSTLLQIICGILKPTTGTVEVAGRISALLELGTGFNPEFTGRENVFLNGALMSYTREEMEERYQGILDFADIGNFINQPVKTYSSGMYVRLAFACAVNVDPEILVVDEALSVGDVFFQQKCFRKMAEFKERGKTMLLVSHSVNDILLNCDKVLYLSEGTVAAFGEAKNTVNLYLQRNSTPMEPKQPEGAGIEPGELVVMGIGGVRSDRCKSRPGYNDNEYRYGNGKASVVDYEILDAEGKAVASVYSGSTISFRYFVEYDQLVEYPIYGFSVKTKSGVVIYNTNTWSNGVRVDSKGSGESVMVEFVIKTNLAPGDYFVTTGVAEHTEKGIIAVDRRYDLARLVVLSSDFCDGLANLFAEIKVK